jgi:hypothetical protein
MNKQTVSSSRWGSLCLPHGTQRFFKLILCIIFLLLMVRPGVSHAHADTLQDRYYSLGVVMLDGKICPGDEVTIPAWISLHDIWLGPWGSVQVSGIPITVSGGKHGAITPSTIVTAPRPDLFGKHPQWWSGAGFTYKAKKPGVETLTFEAKGLVREISFKVEVCQYSILMIHHGGGEFTGGYVTSFGAMEQVVLEEEAENHYTGSGTFQMGETWSFQQFCSINIAMGLSQAQITAEKHDKLMDITIDYSDPPRTAQYDCELPLSSVSGIGENPDFYEPVMVSIPASGGSETYVQPGPGYVLNFTVILEKIIQASVSLKEPERVSSLLSPGDILSLAALRGDRP